MKNEITNEITTLIQKGKLPQDTLNQIHSLKCKKTPAINNGGNKNEKHTIRPSQKRRNKRRNKKKE